MTQTRSELQYCLVVASRPAPCRRSRLLQAEMKTTRAARQEGGVT